jgi:hypothetical protein
MKQPQFLEVLDLRSLETSKVSQSFQKIEVTTKGLADLKVHKILPFAKQEYA